MLGQFFDPAAEWFDAPGCRPHWVQPGTVVFVTFRTRDSIPAEVVRRWEWEKQEWLKARGYEDAPWESVLPTLPIEQRVAFRKQFDRHRETFLDDCHGRCVLEQPELARIVADALLYFDGERYHMGDFVVMPNHVHLLAAFDSSDSMRAQFDSWLHFTARLINRMIGETGKFWQGEPFDHLVRNADQYDTLRRYIVDNPIKAMLSPGRYLYRRYPE